MKQALMGGCLVVLLTVGWLVAQPAETETEIPDDQISVAADGLIDSAWSLTLSPEVPYRGWRMAAMVEMVRQMDPDNPDANRMLADIYSAWERPEASAEALAHSLVGREEDYGLWLRWLASAIEEQQTAGDRIAFLLRTIEDENIPSTVRAQATVEYAGILAGQGKDDKVKGLLLGTLKLDPFNRQALVAWEGVQAGSISAADKVNLRSRLLRGSPRDYVVLHDLATLAGQEGLSQQALVLFDHAWTLAEEKMGVDEMPYTWAVEYANAMLDAGKYRQAVDTIEPLLANYPGRADLPSLIVEAYWALGEKDKAESLISDIENDRIAAGGSMVLDDLEMAMFYMVVKPDPQRAFGRARAAIKGANDDERQSVTVQRVYGATELLGGAIDSGVARLEAVQPEDMWASVFLANHYFHIDKPVQAAQAVEAGLALGRSGPAARRLRLLAGELDAPIEPRKGAAAIAKTLGNIGDDYFEMALAPEEFVAVSIDQPEGDFVVGENMSLTCRLKNVGSVVLPMGPKGLLQPSMAVEVSVTGSTGKLRGDMDAFPLAVWPCPKYLKPGEEVICQVQLDIGELADLLAREPLEDLTLSVTGILSPAETDDGELTSAVPTIEIPAVTIRRAGLLGVPIDQASEDDLASIKDLAASDAFAERVLAARQVGALGAYLYAQSTTVQGPVASVYALQDAVEAIGEALLTDASPVVRAEMIHRVVSCSPAIRSRVALAGAADGSPLVRLRAAELLETLDDEASRTALDALVDDSDPQVARMAEVIVMSQSPETPTEAEPAESTDADELELEPDGD